MIEMLRGVVFSKSGNKIVLDCNGVGYGVTLSTFSIAKIGDAGKEATILTYLKVREDEMSLYGFYDYEEREMFEQLSSVSGIGVKTAITMLSEVKYDKLFSAIVEGDATLISSIKGIGLKTAKKIILELKDKFIKLNFIARTTIIEKEEPVGNINNEAVLALVKLGLKQNEAAIIVQKIISSHKTKLTTQEIIAAALKNRLS